MNNQPLARACFGVAHYQRGVREGLRGLRRDRDHRGPPQVERRARKGAGMIGAKLGAGREADVHAWGDQAVVKLYRPGFGGHHAEAVALAKLDGRGIAPRLLDTVACDGRTGLVLERLGGSDMLSLLQRQPWRGPGLASALAGTHLAVHEIPAPGDLPELRQVLAARIAHAVLPAHLRAYALRVLAALPDGDRLCHGDYHPGNVLVAADRVAVIDWPNAAHGVPAADHARTMLLCGGPIRCRTRPWHPAH